MKKETRFLLLTVFVLFCSDFYSQTTKTAISNGNWDTPTRWSPTGVPTATDNVLIPNGRSIRIRNANAACNSLTVGAGTAATLQFRGNTARTLTVTNNITINANAAFDIRTASNTSHSLIVGGNIINNGKLDFAVDANSFCNTTFNRNGNQTVSGTGTLTRFHNIITNLGTSITNTVEITASNFAAGNGFLTITNGTFKLSNPNTVSAACFSVAVTIPTTGRLFLNSATAALSASANVTCNGNITVANGTLNVGNANDEDLISNGGGLTLTGGVLNIAGKYNTTGAASTFSISGGTINVPVNGSTNTVLAPFNMSVASSSFNMSGGIINIIREGGTGAQDLGFTNSGGTLGTVTGGTLQLGTAATPAGQIMKINSVNLIGNLTMGSANATASLITNPLNVFRNILISSGTLNSNNLNITLGGNWTNNGGTFTPGTATTTFSSTIAQSIFKAAGETFNNITFTGSGTKTFSSAVTSNSNVVINSGATVDVSTSNFQLSIAKNFTNNGAITTRSGTIVFNGSSAQTIGGTTTTNFYNLTINNTAGGVSLLNAENLINTLTLSGGVFSTNAQVFTMISTASNTARIGPITGSGNISGNVTVQRFAPGSITGWALFGTPLSSALTLNDWDDDIFISCATCPDGSASGFISIYTYSESLPGVHDDPASYIPMSTINDPIIPNKGYWVYLGTGSVTTTDITLDVTGSVRKFANTIPLAYTNNGSAADDGWNLIHNPYPCPISWTALRNANASVDNAIYVYNADLNGGAGAFATYINNVSSPAVGAGGVGDDIPMSQGFYVHATAATNLTAQETNKTLTNPTYLKMQNPVAPAANLPLVRFTLTNASGFEDETVLYYQNGATDNFDADYDAYKMAGQDPKAPTIALEKTKRFQVNGISPVSGNLIMPLKTLTGYTGTYTISAKNISSFPAGACVNLYDKFTSTTIDLKTSDYVFILSDTTTVARFDLTITSNTLNINSTTNQPSCAQPNSGEITAIGVSSGPWNYTWRDNGGNIIKTSLSKATSDTLKNLAGNTYYVEVNTVGNCDNNSSTFVLNPIIVPVASFTSEDSTDLNWNGLVNFVNTSINSSNAYWDFGDGIGTSITNSPSYNYTSIGTYLAKLITTSSTGCNDTITKNILVRNEQAIGIQTYANASNLLIKTLDENEYLLEQKFNSETILNFKLMDSNGRLVNDYGTTKSDKIYLPLNLKNYSKGIYFLTITANNKPATIKLSVK